MRFGGTIVLTEWVVFAGRIGPGCETNSGVRNLSQSEITTMSGTLEKWKRVNVLSASRNHESNASRGLSRATVRTKNSCSNHLCSAVCDCSNRSRCGNTFSLGHTFCSMGKNSPLLGTPLIVGGPISNASLISPKDWEGGKRMYMSSFLH